MDLVRSARGRPDETRRRMLDPMFADDPGQRAWLEGTLLRPGQVALLLQVSRRSVAAWAREGRLPSITTPGGHRRFRADDVRRLVDSLTVTVPAGSTPDRLAKNQTVSE
ncbi:MAG TPA: helix-turn-helix domain-containing protein [Actinomycetota bacterium]|nr:helix-turn-helix domain-containing protein [Actinomycetota bacterium]